MCMQLFTKILKINENIIKFFEIKSKIKIAEMLDITAIIKDNKK